MMRLDSWRACRTFWAGMLMGVVLAVWGCRKKQGAAPPARSVAPVIVARDVPVYIDPIGTCTAREVASIHSQVSGQIIQIHFQSPTVQGVWQGDAQTFRATVGNLVVLMFLAVFVMYVILGILYESYLHPITVLSSLPVALVGRLLVSQLITLYITPEIYL